MSRADRKRERRELAGWLRANGVTPSGEAWRLASVEGSRDVSALVAANVADGCPAKRLPDGQKLPAGLRPGDPVAGGTVAGTPVLDTEHGTVWVVVTDDTGSTRDVELPASAPVVPTGDVPTPPKRKRPAPAWVQAAAADYRAARDAWEALRESDTLAPSSVPGIAGSDATMSQLEDADYKAAVPRPRYADYVRDHAARNRQPA